MPHMTSLKNWDCNNLLGRPGGLPRFCWGGLGWGWGMLRFAWTQLDWQSQSSQMSCWHTKSEKTSTESRSAPPTWKIHMIKNCFLVDAKPLVSTNMRAHYTGWTLMAPESHRPRPSNSRPPPSTQLVAREWIQQAIVFWGLRLVMLQRWVEINWNHRWVKPCQRKPRLAPWVSSSRSTYPPKPQMVSCKTRAGAARSQHNMYI